MAFRWLENLRELFTREREDDDLAREVRSHLDEETEEQIERGVPPEEAPYAARRAFGNVTRVEERTREAWRGEGIASSIRELAGGVVQDARYGLKGLIKQPTFTIAAILALALGIGATTTIFSVIQNVLLDPYPMYRNVNRMVGIEIHNDDNSRPGGRDFLQTAEFLDYQAQMTSFDAVIAGGGDGSALYAGPQGVEQLNGAYLSGNTFEVLGIGALIGRTITSDDGKPGAPPVFVMSYKLWANRFGMDPTLIGKTFTLDGMPTTLIGVMPPRVSKLGADVWRPILLDRANLRCETQYFKFQGRLKPGVTLEQADAEFRTVAARVSKPYPRNYPEHFSAHVLEFVDSIVGAFPEDALHDGRCGRAAAAHRVRQRREHAVEPRRRAPAGARAPGSLGASRGRLVRQLLIESLMLACVGMAVGCLFAYFGIKALVGVIPEGLIPRESLIRLDMRVLAVQPGGGWRHGARLRSRAGVPVGGTGSHEPAARRGEGHGRRLSRRTVEQRPRRRRDRALARALDLGRRADAQRHQAADHGAGFRAGEPAARRDSHRPRRPQDGCGTDTIRHAGAGAHSHVARDRPRREHRRLSAVWRAGRGVRRGRRRAPGSLGRPARARRRRLFPDAWRPGRAGTRFHRGRHPIGATSRRRQPAVRRALSADDQSARTDGEVRHCRNDQGQDEEQGYEIVGVVQSVKNSGVNNPIEPEVFAPISVAPLRWQSIMVRTAGPPLRGAADGQGARSGPWTR